MVGTGKTTAAGHLRDALGASCLHFPPAFRIFRDQARLDEEVGPWARLAYYLGASLHTGEMARAGLRSGPVECDRYAPSPLAMPETEGLFDEAELRSLSEPFLARLLQPTIIVLLTAERDVARRRVERRMDTLGAVHQRVVVSDPFYLGWHLGLKRTGLRCRVLTDLRILRPGLPGGAGEHPVVAVCSRHGQVSLRRRSSARATLLPVDPGVPGPRQ